MLLKMFIISRSFGVEFFKLLANLTKMRREKTQMNKTSKKGEITKRKPRDSSRTTLRTYGH
jgi:hypothetical protein